jgi:hypothetical protein
MRQTLTEEWLTIPDGGKQLSSKMTNRCSYR